MTTAITPPAGTLPWTLDIARGWRVIQGPAREPITLAQARSHLRLSAFGSPPAHPDDDWIMDFGLPASRQWCEGFLERSCALQLIEMQISRFPGTYTMDGGSGVELMMAPVASVTSVSYLDTGGAEQTTAAYAVTGTDPPQLYLTTSGASWPDTFGAPGAVRIRYYAGYSVGDESPMLTPPIPQAIKLAILMLLAHFYENREATFTNANFTEVSHELALGVKTLLQPYVLRLSMA